MLKWREDYYVGEGIKDAAKARRRIDAGRVAFGVYLVTLSENPGNLLEIVPSYMLIQKSYYARCPEIVGMAKGKDEAIDLLEQNKRKFGTDNLEIIKGLAPEALEGLPAPTHAFIGGSSGNLKEILEVLLEQNPRVRVVINAIALETVAEAMQCLKSMAFTDVDIAQVSVAKGKKLGSYEMMMGQNPVYIFSCTGGEIA